MTGESSSMDPPELPSVVLGAAPLLGNLTGIGQYTLQLASALKTLRLVDDLRLWGDVGFLGADVLSLTQQTLASHGGISCRARQLMRAIRRVASKSYAAALLHEQVTGRAAAWRLAPLQDSHLYHATNFVLPRFDGRKVMTVHDLSVIRFPEFHRRQMVEICERGIRSAIDDEVRIIVPSDLVGRELTTQFGVADALVTTVHHAADAQCRPRSEAECRDVLVRWDLRYRSFFISVGTIEPRKNLIRLFEAFRIGRAQALFDWPLVVVGGHGWHSKQEHALLRELCQDGLALYLDYIDDASLRQLYSAAGALVFPSLYEGFGLPVAEAMASGCPVVTSRGTAMEEFADDQAVLVNPLDELAICDAMRQIALSPPRVATQPTALKRTWADVATETAAVYCQAL